MAGGEDLDERTPPRRDERGGEKAAKEPSRATDRPSPTAGDEPPSPPRRVRRRRPPPLIDPIPRPRR